MIRKIKLFVGILSSIVFVNLVCFTSINGQSGESGLSRLLMDGNYRVSNGYRPNGVHAGIDFGGKDDSKISVKAPISGTIIANTPACGKVAIYDGRNTIILAHMANRTGVGTGSQISKGDYVGKASQVVGGGCSASGPHLHIEIRTGRNSTMALPTNDNRNSTLNPATYFSGSDSTPISSPTVWEFNRSGNREGWNIYNFDAVAVRDGVLFIDPQGDDPYLFSPSINVDASSNSYVILRMASNGLDNRGSIFFKTQAENSYSENKKVDFTVNNCSLCGNAPFRNYSIRMSNHPKWSGTITGIRLDPTTSGKAGTNTDSIGVDYIRLSASSQ